MATLSASPRAAGTARAPARHVNRWLVLVVVCLAQFMVVLDATVVNVALPSIQSGLGFSAESLQWVVNIYTLTFGGFLLLGGRAADLIGRKRLFVAGVALFTIASAINGFATSEGMLIAGRGLQGLGGALVSPAALSILTTTFDTPRERTRALGVWSAIAASGAAFGLILGGVLTEKLSWEWVFFVNLPVGLIAAIAALRFVPESRADVDHRSFDVLGAVTSTAGLLVLVYTVVKAQAWGWTSSETLAFGATAIALLTLFIVTEARSRHPLMRLGIFKIRALAVANGSLMLIMSGMMSMFFFLSLYVQQVLHYSPMQAGFAFLPVSLGIMIGAGLAQQLIARFGPRIVAVVGGFIAAGGMVLLTQLPVHGTYVRDLLVGLVPLAIGMGLVFVPITLLATAGVSTADAGLASGLYNTAQQVGGALGLAVLATVAANHTAGSLTSSGATSGSARVSALVDGFDLAFGIGAGLLALAAVLLLVFLRPRHVPVIDPDAAVAVAV